MLIDESGGEMLLWLKCTLRDASGGHSGVDSVRYAWREEFLPDILPTLILLWFSSFCLSLLRHQTHAGLHADAHVHTHMHAHTHILRMYIM